MWGSIGMTEDYATPSPTTAPSDYVPTDYGVPLDAGPSAGQGPRPLAGGRINFDVHHAAWLVIVSGLLALIALGIVFRSARL